MNVYLIFELNIFCAQKWKLHNLIFHFFSRFADSHPPLPTGSSQTNWTQNQFGYGIISSLFFPTPSAGGIFTESSI